MVPYSIPVSQMESHHPCSNFLISGGLASVVKSKSVESRPRMASRTHPPTSANGVPEAEKRAANSLTSGAKRPNSESANCWAAAWSGEFTSSRVGVGRLARYAVSMTPAQEQGALPPFGQLARPTPAALAGKKRPSEPPTRTPPHVAKEKSAKPRRRNEEISAGGLVIDPTGDLGLLIGRHDKRGRTLWSLPKGHIEAGETPEEAAIREVAEETGIESAITRSLGVIDFWFMAGGKRIHKTVHHYLFKEVGGHLQPQVTEVDDVGWFPLEEIVNLLAYPDEKKLIAKSGELVI